MYATAIYPINDYRYYLQHHGIQGQKWGQRKVPWYPIAAYQAHLRRHGHRGNQWSSSKYMDRSGNLTAAGKERAEKDGTGFKARMKIRGQGIAANVRDTIRSTKEAKGFINKASELVGHGQAETVARNEAYTQKRLAEASKTRLGKHLHNVSAENSKNLADMHSSFRDMTLGRRVLEGIVPVTVLKTPMKTITGRKTSVGLEYLTLATTGAIGAVALEAAYRGIKPLRKKIDERYDKRTSERSSAAKTSYENAEKERADYKQMKAEEQAANEARKAEKISSKQSGQEKLRPDRVYSSEQKKQKMDNARKNDMYEHDFLETVQNDPVLKKRGKELQKEYKKYLDNPDKYMTTFEKSDYARNYKHSDKERAIAAKVRENGYSSLSESEKRIFREAYA